MKSRTEKSRAEFRFIKGKFPVGFNHFLQPLGTDPLPSEHIIKKKTSRNALGFVLGKSGFERKGGRFFTVYT